jgi:hypothetical protein
LAAAGTTVCVGFDVGVGCSSSVGGVRVQYSRVRCARRRRHGRPPQKTATTRAHAPRGRVTVCDGQVAMQDIVTADVNTLFIPASSIQLLSTTQIVASGGGGRIYRVELREAVVSPRGVRLAKGTPVVRFILAVVVVLVVGGGGGDGGGGVVCCCCY